METGTLFETEYLFILEKDNLGFNREVQVKERNIICYNIIVVYSNLAM